MPKWANDLKAHAETKRRASPKAPAVRKPRGPVEEFYITVRGARDNDPGEVAVGFFIVDDGLVTLTDAKGEPVKDLKPEKLGEADPRYIAGLLLRKRRGAANSDFTRPLHYPPMGIA